MTAYRGCAAAIGLCLLLCGCARPMGMQEAQMRAGASLGVFCRTAACGPVRLVRAQKLKNRWLVDFDGTARKYAVTVDRNGATQVSVWDKNPAATGL